MDSTVLLYALHQLQQEIKTSPVSAIHINHALQQEAEGWGAHCQHLCDQLDIPLLQFRVDATPAAAESPEAAARSARYQTLQQQLGSEDQLLTAHHLDDQAETFLLRALRGSGPKGLAAMRAARPLGRGVLLRPLLAYSRESLLAYAVAEQLQWVEDPSNQQLDADRNFLRHQIFPALRSRWPAAATTLSRSAAHCGEADLLLEQWGRDRLAGLTKGDPLALVDGESREEVKVKIRCWLSLNSAEPPDYVHMQRILDEVVGAREDAAPLVGWMDRSGDRVEVRRFRQALYLLTEEGGRVFDSPVEWAMGQPLQLTPTTQLQRRRCLGSGLRSDALSGRRVTVAWRSGGERCQPAGLSGRRTLKNLLREADIPPWKRKQIPLLYIDGELAQVVGHFVCESFAAKADEEGVLVEIATLS